MVQQPGPDEYGSIPLRAAGIAAVVGNPLGIEWAGACQLPDWGATAFVIPAVFVLYGPPFRSAEARASALWLDAMHAAAARVLSLMITTF